MVFILNFCLEIQVTSIFLDGLSISIPTLCTFQIHSEKWNFEFSLTAEKESRVIPLFIYFLIPFDLTLFCFDVEQRRL